MKQDIRNRQKLLKAIEEALRKAKETGASHSVIKEDMATDYYTEGWYNGQKTHNYGYILTVDYQDAMDLVDESEDQETFSEKAESVLKNKHKFLVYDEVELNGRLYNWEVFLNLADPSIIDELHCDGDNLDLQEFFDAYREEHLKKYGEEFTIN